MLRYVLTVAGALAMISNVAFAEMGDGATTKVITRSAEPGMASKKVIIHRHDDGFGPSKRVVIKRRDDGFGATKKVVISGMTTATARWSPRRRSFGTTICRAPR